LGEVLASLQPKNVSYYEIFTQAQERDRWQTLEKAVMNLVVP
jgi:hypothetical protein